MDTSRLVETGFEYRYTSAGAVESFARANNLRRTIGRSEPEYRYEREVEQFFRHSPAVVRAPPDGFRGNGVGGDGNGGGGVGGRFADS